MDLINKIKSVLLQPSKFFEDTKKEKGLKIALDYYATLLAFSIVMGIIMDYTLNPAISAWLYSLVGLTYTPQILSFWDVFLFPLIGYFMVLVISFAWVGLLQAWILLFGGKEDFSKTYQLNAYSSTPSLVLGWIPFVGFFASLYGIFLLIVGTQKLHGVEKNKSILMYVVPLALVALLFIGLIIIFLAAIYSIGALPSGA